MSEMTQEDALLLADALAGQALKETEARCSVLAQFKHGGGYEPGALTSRRAPDTPART